MVLPLRAAQLTMNLSSRRCIERADCKIGRGQRLAPHGMLEYLFARLGSKHNSPGPCFARWGPCLGASPRSPRPAPCVSHVLTGFMACRGGAGVFTHFIAVERYRIEAEGENPRRRSLGSTRLGTLSSSRWVLWRLARESQRQHRAGAGSITLSCSGPSRPWLGWPRRFSATGRVCRYCGGGRLVQNARAIPSMTSLTWSRPQTATACELDRR